MWKSWIKRYIGKSFTIFRCLMILSLIRGLVDITNFLSTSMSDTVWKTYIIDIINNFTQGNFVLIVILVALGIRFVEYVRNRIHDKKYKKRKLKRLSMERRRQAEINDPSTDSGQSTRRIKYNEVVKMDVYFS